MFRLFFLFCFLVFSSEKIFAYEKNFLCREENQYNVTEEKIYLAPDQLVLSDKGLFVLIPDDSGLIYKIFVPQINYDNQGLFVFTDLMPERQLLERCPKGHPASCRQCIRCQVFDCPYRCKCTR